MKKTLLISIAIMSTLSLFAQRPKMPTNYNTAKLTAYKVDSGGDIILNKDNTVMASTKAATDLSESNIGETVYDKQTNESMHNRFSRFADGTMAAVWTMGFESSDGTFPDRGTGYNYSNGSEWMSIPTERIEDERVGWPSHAPLGSEGEVVVAHTGTQILVQTRETKGSGAWQTSYVAGPDGHDLLWPRISTNDNTIHLLGALPNTDNGGTVYQGLDGAVLYSRSLDGGQTWTDQNQILNGMTSEDYTGLNSDTYILASNGDVTAIVVSGAWYHHDLFMLKTIDNGDTWEKTIIWENPFTNVEYDDILTDDTLWAADGTATVDIGDDGTVHVAFGLCWVYKTETGTGSTYQFFPGANGIIYWNDTMDPFYDENPYDALSYNNLIEDETYIGWLPDINENGQFDYYNDDPESIFTYLANIGSANMPSIKVQGDNLFLAYSTVIENLHSGEYHYRHIYGRQKTSLGWSDIYDITSGDLHMFDECVYPMMGDVYDEDEFVYTMYFLDNTPGFGVDEDHEYINNMVMMAKYNSIVSNSNIEQLNAQHVSDCYPNPAKGYAYIDIILETTSNVTYEIYNLTGQRLTTNSRNLSAGTHQINLDLRNLNQGIYLCRININTESITRKISVN